jgi:hypothetical protein
VKRGGPLRRTPLRSKPPPNPISVEARHRVRRRSSGWCEVQHPGCTGRAEHVHHVLPRSAGGANHPDNLLDVCGAGHRYIHANPAWAYDHGYLSHRA